MKIIAVIAYTLVLIGLPQARAASRPQSLSRYLQSKQMQAASLTSSPNPVKKAMLLKLIAPDKSEHLIGGMAHRLGLRLEQLPEIVGAIKQSNVLIGELAPCWGNPQQSACRTTATFRNMEIAVSTAISQLKTVDDETEETGQLVHKLQTIGRNLDKMKENNYQWLVPRTDAEMDDNAPIHNIQVIKEGKAKIDIAGMEVHFNPRDSQESLVVQLLAGGLDNLVKVSLTRQDVGEASETQPDPETAYPGQSHQPLVEQLGEERLHKLRNMLQQHDDNPIANILNLTLEHQQAAHVIYTLSSIALREASKAYGDQLDHDAPTLDVQIATTALGGTKKHVALEELEDWQQYMSEYHSEAREHFRSLDSFIGTNIRLKEFIDRLSIETLAKGYQKTFAAYFKGDVVTASSLPHTSRFNPYYEDIVLDQRNLKWMEEGKIQQHCTKDNQCLVYVGFSHLLRGKHPLIKLLQNEGFEIRELTNDERVELLRTASSASDTHEAHEYQDKRSNKLSEVSLQEKLLRGSKKPTQQQINDMLVEAAAVRDIEGVKWAVKQGVDEHSLGQALLESVPQDYEDMELAIEMVKTLVAKLAEGDPDNFYYVINRAMVIAALHGKINIVKLLTSKGANDFNAALTSAAYSGRETVVKYCLAQGANDIAGALTNAVIRDHTKLVKFLLPKLEDKMSSTDFSSTLNYLLPFSAGNKDMKMLELLVNAGANDFNSLLLHAINVGDQDSAKFAVKKGASNFVEAFLQAMYVDHVRLVKYLFDLLQQESSESNHILGKAFAIAMLNENTELAKFLVRENAVNIDTATMVTIDHESMLKYVVQKGVKDPTWSTIVWVIDRAVWKGWTEIVAIILEEMNYNPLDVLLTASMYGKEEVVRLILQLGVDIGSLRTASELAALYGNDTIHQLLSDKLAQDKLLTASTRVKKFFDTNISLATDADDALAQKIVHNNMSENNVAFTRLDAAVKTAGGWQALAVAMQSNTSAAQTRFSNILAQAVTAGKDEQLLSEVVLLYRLISAVQKLEGGTNQRHARGFGLGNSYSYRSHLESKRDFNLKKMQAHIQGLRTQYADNKELLDVVDAVAARWEELHQ